MNYGIQDTDDHRGHPASAELAQYQRYLRDELPARVREELVVAVESELEPVEEPLRARLPDIVRIVHRELVQSFQRSLLAPSQTGTTRDIGDPVLSMATTDDQHLPQSLVSHLDANQDPLALFWDESFASDLFAGYNGHTLDFEPPGLNNHEDQHPDSLPRKIPHSLAAITSGPTGTRLGTVDKTSRS